MLKRLARFDRLIAESEAKIIEQVFLIMSMEAEGQDTRTAKQALDAFEGILNAQLRLRETIAETRRLIEEVTMSVLLDGHLVSARGMGEHELNSQADRA